MAEDTRIDAGDSPDWSLAPGLYLVATPIGNLRDITLRALDVLAAVDLIACEDTRISRRLLAAHAIRTPLFCYHDHNATAAGQVLLRRLQRGERVALISDAGTPLVSDPGYRLVWAAVAAGCAVRPIPGPSAPVAALCAAGLPCDRFLFAGFLPSKASARRRALETLSDIAATLVFFESPRRLAVTLADMAALWPGRSGVVAREMTKLFEEFRRAPLSQLAVDTAAASPPKGEVVILVGPADMSAAADPEAIDALLVVALRDGTLRDAVSRVATMDAGLSRRALYQRALALRFGAADESTPGVANRSAGEGAGGPAVAPERTSDRGAAAAHAGGENGRRTGSPKRFGFGAGGEVHQ